MSVIRKIVVCLFVAISLVGGAEAQPRVQPPTQAQISAFLANPGATLAANLNGSSEFIALVQAAALSGDPSAVAMLVSLLSNANPSQQYAIGAGLGRAVLNSPDLADTIQTALAAAGNSTANAAYAGVTGNTVTAAAGGGGGGGGGVGGPTFGGGGFGGGGGGSNISQGQVNSSQSSSQTNGSQN